MIPLRLFHRLSQCTLYTLQCTVYSVVQCELFSVYCEVCSVQCVVWSCCTLQCPAPDPLPHPALHSLATSLQLVCTGCLLYYIARDHRLHSHRIGHDRTRQDMTGQDNIYHFGQFSWFSPKPYISKSARFLGIVLSASRRLIESIKRPITIIAM